MPLAQSSPRPLPCSCSRHEARAGAHLVPLPVAVRARVRHPLMRGAEGDDVVHIELRAGKPSQPWAEPSSATRAMRPPIEWPTMSTGWPCGVTVDVVGQVPGDVLDRPLVRGRSVADDDVAAAGVARVVADRGHRRALAPAGVLVVAQRVLQVLPLQSLPSDGGAVAVHQQHLGVGRRGGRGASRANASAVAINQPGIVRPPRAGGGCSPRCRRRGRSTGSAKPWCARGRKSLRLEQDIGAGGVRRNSVRFLPDTSVQARTAATPRPSRRVSLSRDLLVPVLERDHGRRWS